MLALLIWRWLGPDVGTVWAPAALAQVSPSPVNPSAWEQYGPAGLSAGIFATIAWILFNMQRETLKLERDRYDQAQAQINELNKIMRETTIPALTANTTATTELVNVTLPALRQAKDALAEALRDLQDQRKDRRT